MLCPPSLKSHYHAYTRTKPFEASFATLCWLLLHLFADALAVHACSGNAVNGRGADIGCVCRPVTGTQRDVNAFKHIHVSHVFACVCVSVSSGRLSVCVRVCDELVCKYPKPLFSIIEIEYPLLGSTAAALPALSTS